MAYGTHRSLPARGASPGFRFTLYAILSITLMFLDQRSGWLDHARYLMQGAAYPIQLAVNSPSAAWHWLEESFETRDTLRAENAVLKRQQQRATLAGANGIDREAGISVRSSVGDDRNRSRWKIS